MSIDAIRLSPQHRGWWLCRCSEPVHLPMFGQATVTCKCGRRHAFDGEMVTIVRPEGERESS